MILVCDGDILELTGSGQMSRSSQVNRPELCSSVFALFLFAFYAVLRKCGRCYCVVNCIVRRLEATSVATLCCERHLTSRLGLSSTKQQSVILLRVCCVILPRVCCVVTTTRLCCVVQLRSCCVRRRRLNICSV